MFLPGQEPVTTRGCGMWYRHMPIGGWSLVMARRVRIYLDRTQWGEASRAAAVD